MRYEIKDIQLPTKVKEAMQMQVGEHLNLSKNGIITLIVSCPGFLTIPCTLGVGGSAHETNILHV